MSLSFHRLRQGSAAVLSVMLTLGSTLGGLSLPQTVLAAAQDSAPILPAIDASMKTRLRTILATGQARGNRPNVFAKIGDSITESGSFLVDTGCGWGDLGSYTSLGDTISYFRLPQPGQPDFPASYSASGCASDLHGSNSFTRSSVAAVAGWTVGQALEGGASSPLLRELQTMRPSIAIIMYGTNDLERSTVPTFEADLTQLVDNTIAQGTIPVLSTIPARRDSTEMNSRVVNFNEAISRVAVARQIPLVNYWRAMSPLPNQGIAATTDGSPDNVHPSIYPGPSGGGTEAGYFTSPGLQYGYNMRNLTAIQTLEKLKRIVIDNGTADGGTSAPPTGSSPSTGSTGSTSGSTGSTGSGTPTTGTGSVPSTGSTGSTGSATRVRVYVAGESIERRNCFAQAPFTATGALNQPSDNNDDEYGWMIPMAERLKLRRSGLEIDFVGAQTWTRNDDNDYSGEQCSFMRTPGRTSAIAGSSVQSWLEDRGAELSARTHCYNVAFVSRAGNDWSASDTEYQSQLENLIVRVAGGSASACPNPMVYVTAHMPDSQGTVAEQRRRYSALANAAVNNVRAAHPTLRVRFLDVFNAFASNRPTTAFPAPRWLTSSGTFDIARIGRGGDGYPIDGLHPRRLPSIYAGEVTADLIDVGEFVGGASTGSSPAPASEPPPVAPAPPVAPVVPPSVPSPVPVPVPVPATATSAPLIPSGAYTIGTPTLTDIWVDPVRGNDTNSGATRAQALRTVSAAWERVPKNRTLTGTGYRLLLTRGDYIRDDRPETLDHLPNYWEGARGTAQFPIIVQSVDGRGAARFLADLNSRDLHYFYLIDVAVMPNSDALHFAASDHILVRGVAASGGNRQAHETMKVNQVQYMYLEDSDISGADDNAVDFVAVQYGHVLNNKIHNAADWCLYTKGGSAELRIEGNEIYDCGVGGYVAGQGTGFQYMVSPWIHYEAYDIKFINNVIHDTRTAGMGVNGGYNILLAHNTLYRAGTADHFFEANHGRRACDPGAESPLCAPNHRAGGWGPAAVSEETQYIPSRHVYVYNNIFANPSGIVTPNILQVAGPATPPAGVNLTGTQVADQDLVFRGNIIWNGSTNWGLEDRSGCQAPHPTCNPTQLARDNRLNTLEPRFVNAAAGDFRLANDVLRSTVVPIPSFAGGDLPATPRAPGGTLTNNVSTDRASNTRSSTNTAPGAYILGASTAAPTLPAPVVPPPATPPVTPVPPVTEPSEPAPTTGAEPSEGIVEDADAAARTDLSVALYATPYPNVVQGTNVSYRVTVLNRGTENADDIVLRLSVPANGTFVSARSPQGRCTMNVGVGRLECVLGTLTPGRSVIFPVVFRAVAPGRFAPAATVAFDGEDADETNNAHTVAVTVQPTTPNLVAQITNVSQACRGTGATQRCALRARLTVRNTGNRQAGVSRADLLVTDVSTGREIVFRSYALSALNPNGSRVYNVARNLPAGVRASHISFFADAGAQVAESNETDNRVSTRLP